MDEKKEQLEKVRRAFRDPYLRGWIPNYFLTILEQGGGCRRYPFKNGAGHAKVLCSP